MFVKEVKKKCKPPYKIDTQSYTVGEKITCLWETKESSNAFQGKYVILGVPDDRGVLAAGHCVGAKEGPTAFRKSFYSLYSALLRQYNPVTHHPYPPSHKTTTEPVYLSEKFIDAGDLILCDTIKETHHNLSYVVEQILNAGADTLFIIGGGHDFTYGSYKGHVASRKDEIVPLINFNIKYKIPFYFDNICYEKCVNCHEDSINENNYKKIYHSINRTAFYRIIQDFPKNISEGKALLEIGIQRERNPHYFYETAEKFKIPVVEYLPLLNLWRDLQQAHTQMPLEHIQDHIDDCVEYGFKRKKGSIHLSLSLDIFNQSFAPGSSAGTPMGIDLHDISKSFVFFSKSRDCRVVDIAELCPPRDFHDTTARLVAS